MLIPLKQLSGSLTSNSPSAKLKIQKSKTLLSVYTSVDIIDDELHIAHNKGGKTVVQKLVLEGDPETRVQAEIENILKQKHKLVATSFTHKKLLKKIAPKLWLEKDIVTLLVNKNQIKNNTVGIEEHIKFISLSFDHNNIANIKITQNNEVQVTDLISLKEYRQTSTKEEFSGLMTLSKKFKGHTISFINATPQGGGVALMRHALMRLFKFLKVDAHWYVLKPDLEVFNITKRKFHNILQAVADPKLELTEKDRELYNSWIKENAKIFNQVFKKSDVIVIDDPQPSGLIPYIKKINPNTKIIYRSHIQIEAALANTSGTPQYKTWQFIWNNIKKADLFVSHPIRSFIPKDVPDKKIMFMPATTDPLDGLNKPLNKQQISYYLDLFNKFLEEEGQIPLDLKRAYIIQIARFDPSKGIPDVLNSYLKLAGMLKKHHFKIPQLVIAGNGSIDDPDREPIFNKVMEIVNSKQFSWLKNDIKVVRLPHLDQLLNTLLRESKIVLQLSTKEGFEIKVTEALIKGKPVIAYQTGGIPLQIKDSINGFLVEPGQTNKVAQHLFDLLTDEVKYQQMSEGAQRLADRSLLTIPNAARWLSSSLKLLGKL